MNKKKIKWEIRKYEVKVKLQSNFKADGEKRKKNDHQLIAFNLFLHIPEYSSLL